MREVMVKQKQTRCSLIVTLLLMCLMMPVSMVMAAEHCPAKQQIDQFVDDNLAQEIQFLEKVVNINSGTYNIAGVHAVGDVFKKELQALGFAVHWVPMPKDMQRAGHLVAEHVGTQGKRILLLGHLDTVFSARHPFQTFARYGDTAVGPGVIDNKGGDTIILYALKALHATGALKDASITVILTGDEESIGTPIEKSREIFKHVAKNVDLALEFEWSEALDKVTVARRGRSKWQLVVNSRADHSYDIFRQGKGAIYQVATILDEFYKVFTKQYGVSISPSLIVGGRTAKIESGHGEASGKGNVTPAKAIVAGDLRYISEMQRLSVEKKMQRIVNRLAGESASLHFQRGKSAIPLTLKNQELLLQFSRLSQALGYGPVKASDPLKRGASDLSYVASVVPENLSGLGAVGRGSHSMEEMIELKSLPIATKRAALLLYTQITSQCVLL